MNGLDRPVVLDLFCGAGGLSLGAYRAGFNVVAGFDRDEQAVAIHRANFPESIVRTCDLSVMSPGQLLSLARRKHVNGVIGGPPCQGFSCIGRREASDPRNSLFVKFFEAVAKIGPDFFVAENVPGILEDEIRAAVVNKGLEYVRECYEILPPITLNAADFGAPTDRKRVLFIGFKAKVDLDEFQSALDAAKVKSPVLVKTALFGVGKASDARSAEIGGVWGRVCWPRHVPAFAERLSDMVPNGVGNSLALDLLRRRRLSSGFQRTLHSPEVTSRFDRVKPGEGDVVSRAIRLDPNRHCPVIRAGTGPERGSHTAIRPIHCWEPRVITPREAARLQGFPDWFLLHQTIWHSFRHIGNSVSPILAEKVLSVIRRFI